MTNPISKSIGFSAALSAAAILFAVSSANATPFLADAVPQGFVNHEGQAKVHLAGDRRRWRQNRRAKRRWHRRHGHYRGKRYRYRRHGYSHYYGGYWYPYAWWLGTAAAAAIVANQNRAHRRNAGDAHVNWCLNRYRSYNPRTDMFLAYSGRYKPCISPYSY